MAPVSQNPILNLTKRARAAKKETRNSRAQARNEQHKLARRVRKVGEIAETARQERGGT